MCLSQIHTGLYYRCAYEHIHMHTHLKESTRWNVRIHITYAHAHMHTSIPKNTHICVFNIYSCIITLQCVYSLEFTCAHQYVNVHTSLEFKCTNYHFHSLDLQYAYPSNCWNLNVHILLFIGICWHIESYDSSSQTAHVHVSVHSVVCAREYAHFNSNCAFSLECQCDESEMWKFIGISHQMCMFIGISAKTLRILGSWKVHLSTFLSWKVPTHVFTTLKCTNLHTKCADSLKFQCAVSTFKCGQHINAHTLLWAFQFQRIRNFLCNVYYRVHILKSMCTLKFQWLSYGVATISRLFTL